MSCRSSLSFMAPPPAGHVRFHRSRYAAVQPEAATGGARMLFGEEHVKRYVETDGREGHDWNGVPVLRSEPGCSSARNTSSVTSRPTGARVTTGTACPC